MRRLELAVVGGRGEQRAEDLKAQTCPSHARARRVVVVGHGPPARRDVSVAASSGPYADAEKHGSAPSSARSGGGPTRLHRGPSRKRDPSRAARRGDRREPAEQLRDAGRRVAGEPLEQRGGQPSGDRARAPAAPTAPRTARVVVNGPRHQRSHRRVVRAGTPVVRVDRARASSAASATTLATITTAPTYTRRPRNRTDGGVARRRHPSRPQQRLKRRRERLGRRRPAARREACAGSPRGAAGRRRSRHGSLRRPRHDRRVDRRQPLKKLAPQLESDRTSSPPVLANSEASPSERL